MCEVIKENKPQAYVYDWILKTMIQFTFRTMNPFLITQILLAPKKLWIRNGF